ncbi:MAG: hypothetical protein Q7U16_14100 [Agitococcus sp.]|nr:hypothetical protein [Agitococcus sp.]
MNPVRGLIMLFVVSYLIHATLLVNSADSELRNAQQQVGNLLAEQLATSSATLMMNKDSVGLGLLANRFGETSAILSLRIVNLNKEVIASGGSAPSQQGTTFTAEIQLEKQPLGQAEVVLASRARGDIIRDSAFNLLLSLLVHAFLVAWIGWPQLFKKIRIPILQPLPSEAKPVIVAPVINVVVQAEPEPVKAAASVFLYVAFDDRKNLMQKVNVSTSEQFLMIVDKLLKRATRLYTGKVTVNLTAEGAVVRFDGDTGLDCMNRALACGRLLLKLTDTAYHQRRAAKHKQFALRMKVAGLELADLEDSKALSQVQRLVTLATVNQLMFSANDDIVTDLQSKHQLKAFEVEEGSANADIKAHVVEALDAHIEDELTVLEKRILERKKPTEGV